MRERMAVKMMTDDRSIYVTLVAMRVRVTFLRQVSIMSKKDGTMRSTGFSFFSDTLLEVSVSAAVWLRS